MGPKCNLASRRPASLPSPPRGGRPFASAPAGRSPSAALFAGFGYARLIASAIATGPGAPLSRRALGAGLLAAFVAAAFELHTVADRGTTGVFNDFYDYWAAGRVLLHGGNPYDAAVLDQVLSTAGVHSTVGEFGYSYPLFFLLLVVPLALLPAQLAGYLFAVLSLAAFAIAIGLLLTPLTQLGWLEVTALALAAGGFVPVRGSLFFGQANLLVLLALAFAYRERAATLLLALAGAVKLYPAAGLLANFRRGRRGAKPLLLGAGLTGALVLLPNLLSGRRGSTRLLDMLGPDPYWSNASLNGFISRVARPSPWSEPLLPGIPVTPVVVLLALLLVGVSLAVVLRSRPSWSGSLALFVAAATVATPKNSLWNFVPLLLSVAYCWPHARRRPTLLLPLVAGWLLIDLQSSVNVARDDPGGHGRLQTGLLGLAALGGLLIWATNAVVAAREAAEAVVAHRVSVPAANRVP
ncbi:MAG: glycosyltransferase 87 family protein [Candidatus Dormibacteraeota bacterium]|nr:glycosyltransferase 87 family protein [Candidatus Dormibacteraeota bacterium]